MARGASCRAFPSARSGNPRIDHGGDLAAIQRLERNMEFFRIHRTIPFMRHALVLNLISLITFVAAVFFIATRGFHLSIEFTGGTVMEAHYAQTAQVEEIRSAVDSLGYTDFQVQNFGTSQDVLIRLPLRAGETSSSQSETVFGALK